MTEDLNELIIQYRAALAMEAEKQEVRSAASDEYEAARMDHEDAQEVRLRLGRQLLEMIGAPALQPATEAEAAIAEPVAAEKHGIDKETDASTAALAEAKKASDAYIAAMNNNAPREERVRLLQEADAVNERYLDCLVAGPVDELADDVLKATAPADQPEPDAVAGPDWIDPVLYDLRQEKVVAMDEYYVSLLGAPPAEIEERREAYFQADENFWAAWEKKWGEKTTTAREAHLASKAAEQQPEAVDAAADSVEPEPVGQGALAPLSTLTMHVTAWGGDAEMVQTNYSFTEREEVDA